MYSKKIKEIAILMKHPKTLVKAVKLSFFTTTVITLISFGGICYGGIYYVSASGSATWAQSVNILTPCSASTAMTSASAGDTVYFRGGTYKVGQHSGYHGVLEPSNSGTDGSPITFMAYSGETPIMDGTTDGQDIARAMGNGDEDYITFDGFTFTADGGTAMGGIIITGFNIGGHATGNIVKNCIFNGGSTAIAGTDNREGLRIEQADDTLVQRCLFYNYDQVSNNNNTSATKEYHNLRTIIEYCEFYNNSVGIYAKSDTDDSIYRYNYLHDNYQGLFLSVNVSAMSTERIKIYHNLLINHGFNGIGIEGDTGYFNDPEIYNNTTYNTVRGISYGYNEVGHGAKIYNNISANNTFDLYGNSSGTYEASLAECDHNQFSTDSFKIKMRHNGTNPVTYSSLNAWQSSGELDGGGNPGTGSLASDPLFVNSSGSMNQACDFRLDSDSPSKAAGRGGLDMGADIPLIVGNLLGWPPLACSAPGPPTNLRIKSP
jgi:hypothetical protein